jgi:3-methyladenine DNA glycosylase AlkD
MTPRPDSQARPSAESATRAAALAGSSAGVGPSSGADTLAVADDLLAQLRAHASAENAAGVARFGIASAGTIGVSMPIVRSLAKDGKRLLGKDKAARHEPARRLWDSGLHEARIMAALVDDPSLVDEAQAEAWVHDLDSWDVCDQLCINLLRRTAFAWTKAAEWTSAEPEFVKRAAFALGATLAVHDKAATDERFIVLLACAEREATDERNAVKKALNWQIRGIGKRNAALNAAAIAACERILAEHPDSRAARWVARDALRELKSDAVRVRLGIA